LSEKPLQVGEIGVLQHLNRLALNGLIAEVTGDLKRRMLYSITDPADSEICQAYKVCVPGYPSTNDGIQWCVKRHQLRRIAEPDDMEQKRTAILEA
jgi:hypothetical protein